MLSKFFDKMLHDEESEVDKDKIVSEPEKKQLVNDKKDILIATAFFVLAFAIRLVFIYKFTDPQNPGDGWAGDTFHHWQISYLSQQIGFDHGFLRLWDFKGMEFFWGPLHPLMMILLFNILGTVSIEIPRVLSAFFGALTVSLLYLLVNKYWNRGSAFFSALFTMVLPVAILDDTFGLLEQIGVALLLLGIFVLDSSPLLAGFIWALASMVRAEAWMFGLLLVILSKRAIKKSAHYSMVVIGWIVPMLLYLKYLLDYTGNAIYPVYWNYLANATGAWVTEKVEYTSYQLMIRPYLIVWFAISLLLFIFAWFKSKGGNSILTIFMLSYWVFISGMLGLTHYLTGFQPWFWFIRFFEYPYIFAGVFLSIILLYYLPQKISILKHWGLYWILTVPIFLIMIILQFGFWSPIMEKYNSTRPMWDRTKLVATTVSKYYQNGTILIPEGDPNFTYALVYYHGINAKNLEGQMYDPFFYIKGDPFKDWENNREKILGWLKKDNITLMFFYDNVDKYTQLIKTEPQYFEKVDEVPTARLLIYRVFPDKIQLQ